MVAVTGSGTTELKEENHVPYIQFKNLSATGIVKHGFSTRKGGVSTGIFSSMNLNFKRGDDPDAVLENYRRMAAALNMRVEDMVLSDQTHTTNVRVITEEDRGKGILRPQDYSDVDGMITNVPGIVLVTSYADCVPLYFVDPVRKAIGLSHSGWKERLVISDRRPLRRCMRSMAPSRRISLQPLALLSARAVMRSAMMWRRLSEPILQPMRQQIFCLIKAMASISWICGKPIGMY